MRLHDYLKFKILFLKFYLLCNFFLAESFVFRRYNPFFFDIVISMNDCNYFPGKLIDNGANAQNIRILFFAVRSNYPLNITVIYRITDVFVVWVITSKRPVHNYFYGFPYHNDLSIKMDKQKTLRPEPGRKAN